MRRVLSFLFCIALLLNSVGISYAANDDCYLYLDLQSEENLMRATYDMDIYLDDEYIGSVENGKFFTSLVEISKGKHELEVCKSGDNSINALKKFKIESDMTLSSVVAHSKSSIEFTKYKTFDSIIGAELEMPFVTGMLLSEAMNEFKGIGFVNVRPEPNDKIWDRDNWLVVNQSEETGSILDKNAYIELECVKLDDYFEDRYVGMTLNEVQLDAEENDFSLRYESANKDNKSDFNSFIKALSEDEKEDWIVEKARQYGGAKRTAVLTLSSKNDNADSAASSTSSNSSTKKDNKSSTPTPKPVEAISVKAADLYEAFSNNEVAANKKYKGKILDVTGKVGSINSSFGSFTVSLDADEWGITSIECSFKKVHEDDLAKLNKGDKVTIRGTCDGLTIAWVCLSDCELIKVKSK